MRLLGSRSTMVSKRGRRGKSSIHARVVCSTSILACTSKTALSCQFGWSKHVLGESDVRLVPVEWLKAHEEIKIKNMEKLLEMTLKWDGFTKPLIADKAIRTILDGHHRFAVAKRLDFARIPAVCIDYLNDDSVELELWPASSLESISKQDVIDMASLIKPLSSEDNQTSYFGSLATDSCLFGRLSLLTPSQPDENES